MSDNSRLVEHNRKVMAEIMQNNSRASFEKRGEARLHIAKDIGNEALDYIQRKGTGTHESNRKHIEDVLRYYRPDWTDAGPSKKKMTAKEKALSKKEIQRKTEEANKFFSKLLGIR